MNLKNIKVNKSQTMGEQLLEGRRPHISWDNIHPQISEFCEKIYEGTFQNNSYFGNGYLLS